MSTKRLEYLKKAIAQYSLRLDHKGYVANHDGNITVKTEDGFLSTPSAVAKSTVTEEMILSLDSTGKKREGIGDVFGELKMHLAAYQTRSEINAVIHAHPPFATARGLVHKELKPKLPEAVVSIGSLIPVVRHALPGTPESESFLKEALQVADVCLVSGNGVFAVGSDLEQAYLRLELVEHLCQIEYYAGHSGTLTELPHDDVQKLLAKRKSLGLGPQNTEPVPATLSSQDATTTKALIQNIIAEEIQKAILSSFKPS